MLSSKFLSVCSHKCPEGNPLSKKFLCRLCSEELKSIALLKNHFSAYHPNEPVFQCQICNEGFDHNVKKFVDHFIEHKLRKLECSVCLSAFESSVDLYVHYREFHPKSERNVCLTCGRKYNNPSALAKHRHVHTGRRPYHCPLCKDTFTLRASQLIHIRRHFNERPYKCKLCPKRFFIVGELLKHTRCSHTGERPYSCHICIKKFAVKGDFNNHLKRHKSPFKCSECSESFSHKELLNSHMTSHGTVQPFVCPVCFHCYFELGSLQKHIAKFHIEKFNSAIGCQICGVIKQETSEMVYHLMTHRSDRVDSGVKTEGAISREINYTNYQPIKNESITTQKRKRIPNPKYFTSNKNPVKSMLSTTSTPNKRGRPKKTKQTVKENNSYPEHGYNVLDNDVSLEVESEKEFVAVDLVDTLIPDSVSGIQEVSYYNPLPTTNLTCVICSETFLTEEHLVNHISIHI